MILWCPVVYEESMFTIETGYFIGLKSLIVTSRTGLLNLHLLLSLWDQKLHAALALVAVIVVAGCDIMLNVSTDLAAISAFANLIMAIFRYIKETHSLASYR